MSADTVLPSQLRLAEVLSALAAALDMTEGQPQGHCARCCHIGIAVGKELGLDAAQTSNLYYTLLLKDLGCSSNAARICQLYLADDLSFKRDFKQIDGSLAQALRFVLSHTGLKSGLAERFRAIIHIFQNGGELARELIETRCDRGADIARRMRFDEEVAQAIRNLDEHWDGSGLPDRRRAGEIPLFARIALLSQVVDVFNVSGGREAALREVASRSGTWFDPDVVAAFHAAAARPAFWLPLSRSDLEDAILMLEPAQGVRIVTDDYLDDIAAAFAQVIDSKSPYTRGHSERVALFADMIAEELGFTEDRRRWLKRAALLHDIGKLGISNTVLDKPGKLSEVEWAAMKQHAAFTENILSRITAFRDLAVVAAAHHERLDGQGYPKGLTESELPVEARILAVADVFDALTADRPYRQALPVSKALALLYSITGTALDGRCYEALAAAMRRIDASLAA